MPKYLYDNLVYDLFIDGDKIGIQYYNVYVQNENNETSYIIEPTEYFVPDNLQEYLSKMGEYKPISYYKHVPVISRNRKELLKFYGPIVKDNKSLIKTYSYSIDYRTGDEMLIPSRSVCLDTEEARESLEAEGYLFITDFKGWDEIQGQDFNKKTVKLTSNTETRGR